MRLSEHTSAEASVVETRLAVVPVGSTEQHGPHAPLGTDTITAEHVAAAGVEAYERPVVLGPTVPVGVSAEHRGFDGTLWVTPEAFRAYLGDFLRSLAHNGWDRIAVVNGHGGNTDPLREVCADLTRAGEARVAAFTWFDAVGDAGELPEGLAMGHAGAVETSVLKQAAPETLAADAFETASENSADRWGEWTGGVNVAYDTEAFAENGVVGDPTEATADIGVRLLAAATDQLTALLAALDPDAHPDTPGPEAEEGR